LLGSVLFGFGSNPISNWEARNGGGLRVYRRGNWCNGFWPLLYGSNA